MATTPTINLPPSDLSVRAVAYAYLGKKPPIEVEKHIYGDTDPSSRTLKEQLAYLMAGKEATFYLNCDVGDDGNCGSAEQPWRTLAYAFDQIYAIQRTCPDHGHITLILQDGVYTGEGQTYVTLGKHYQDITKEEPKDEHGQLNHNLINQLIDDVTIRNVTIRAQNKWTLGGRDGAILDGGWPPSLVDDDFYANIETAYFDNVPAWALKTFGKNEGEHENSDRWDAILYNRLLELVNCENVTIDGLRIRNSIGAGIHVANHKYPSSNKEEWPEVHSYCRNITIKNCRIDWCHFGAIKADWDQEGCIIENNEITRGAFDWWINLKPTDDRSNGRAGSRYGPMGQPGKDSNWSAVILWANDAIVTGNVCAFSYGEVASRPRSKGALVTNNKFICNSNNCYLEGLQDATVRNNLLVCLPDETHIRGIEDVVHENAFSRSFYRRGRCLAIANEKRNEWCFGQVKDKPWKGYAYCGNIEKTGKVQIVDHLNDDLRVYNNLLLYGFANFRANNDGRKRPIRRLYFGHNTIIAAPKAGQTIFRTSTDKDAWVSGIMENNVWDDSLLRANNGLHETDTWAVGQAGIEKSLRIRNNVFPESAHTYLKTKSENVLNEFGDPSVEKSLFVTNDLQLVREHALSFQPPKTGMSNDDMDKHLDGVKKTLRSLEGPFGLRSGAIAHDNGCDIMVVPFIPQSDPEKYGSTPVPPEVRTQDFLEHGRRSPPDIGAIEYNPVGVVEP